AGEVLPGSGSAGDVGLAAETAFDADFASNRSDLIGEGGERVSHVVDGFGERSDFALGVHRELLREFAVGHRGDDLHDAANLLGEVGGHDVDVVGEVFPRACHARNLSLTAKFAFGTDFASYTSDFRGESVELVDERVDGVFEFENFALNVDGNFAR